MKVYKAIKVIRLFLTAAFITLPSYADYTFPYNGEWWLNAGIGVAAGHNDDVPLPPNIPQYIYSLEQSDAQNVGGAAGEISLNFATTNDQLLTLRYFSSTDEFNTYPFVGTGVGDGRLQEGAVLYGLMAKGQYGYISGSAGLSVVNTGYAGGTDSFGVTFKQVSQTTVGLPLEVQAFFTPFKYLGIGLVGLGDINSHAPVVSGLIELQVGNLA